MAIQDYNPTDWVDDSAPAINALNLNKIETGIDAVTDEVIDLRTNPTVAQETVFGVVKVWTVVAGEITTLHIATT